MLSMSELAMNPNRKVTTKCYGEVKVWNDREEAQAYFLEAMMNSDGAEHDRYSGIYIQLQNGLDYCTDEDDDEEFLSMMFLVDCQTMIIAIFMYLFVMLLKKQEKHMIAKIYMKVFQNGEIYLVRCFLSLRLKRIIP